jgi:hypothetical protein
MLRTVSLLGQPTRPDGQHALQRFRYKDSLTFFCSTPAESAVKRCALAYRRHANHTDPDFSSDTVGIFLTRLLRQLLGLERFRQDDKFKTSVFEQQPLHK